MSILHTGKRPLTAHRTYFCGAHGCTSPDPAPMERAVIHFERWRDAWRKRKGEWPRGQHRALAAFLAFEERRPRK